MRTYDEKNKFLVIVVVILLILLLGLFGYIIYDNLSDKKSNENNNNVSGEENNSDDDLEFENIFADYLSPLGWIAYVSSFDNEGIIKEDFDFFADSYYKQLFVMEYIINKDGDEKFMQITPELGPCCEYYYPYEQFNEVYFDIFNMVFDNDVVTIDNNNYVYYDFYRRFGSNGVYADDINIIDIVLEDDIYVASVEINYSEYTDIDKISATIKYIKNGNGIVFKSFIVKQ